MAHNLDVHNPDDLEYGRVMIQIKKTHSSSPSLKLYIVIIELTPT